jgi:hypothetical protein
MVDAEVLIGKISIFMNRKVITVEIKCKLECNIISVAQYIPESITSGYYLESITHNRCVNLHSYLHYLWM